MEIKVMAGLVMLIPVIAGVAFFIVEYQQFRSILIGILIFVWTLVSILLVTGKL